MGWILVHDIRHLSYSSRLGRARPNRRADISPFRWVLQMKKRTTDEHNHLVGANNELMKELEQCERECYGRGV